MYIDGFDEIHNAAGVFYLILFTSEDLDLHGHRRIWFLFKNGSGRGRMRNHMGMGILQKNGLAVESTNRTYRRVEHVDNLGAITASSPLDLRFNRMALPAAGLT